MPIRRVIALLLVSMLHSVAAVCDCAEVASLEATLHSVMAALARYEARIATPEGQCQQAVRHGKVASCGHHQRGAPLAVHDIPNAVSMQNWGSLRRYTMPKKSARPSRHTSVTIAFSFRMLPMHVVYFLRRIASHCAPAE